MTLPASGSLSMSQMNTELQRPSTQQISMSDATLRSIIGKAAGAQFSFSELRGQAYLIADISPSSVYTTANPGGGNTCDVTGGSGSFSYSWVRISGDTRITANSPSSASTSFSRTGFAPTEAATATFQCTVTDLVSGATASDTYAVTMERPGGGGGGGG